MQVLYYSTWLWPVWLTLTFASISRITIEAGYAGLAVLAGGQVLTLLTDTLVDTFAVAVALASWKAKNFKGSVCPTGGLGR